MARLEQGNAMPPLGPGGGRAVRALDSTGMVLRISRLQPPDAIAVRARRARSRYDDRPVDLTSEQEAIATMYASMIKTDYATKKARPACCSSISNASFDRLGH
jgi:hypothetical protein